jgi:hypothetical protein
MNSYPHTTPPDELPDWSQVKDRAHYEQRTVMSGGIRVSDTVPDEILTGIFDGPPVFVDLACHAALVLGHGMPPLAPTASLWRQDQGRPQRIDRIYATPAVSEALISIEVIITDGVTSASDHAPVVARFDLPALRRLLLEKQIIQTNGCTTP